MSGLIRHQGDDPNDGGMGMNAGATAGQLIEEGKTVEQIQTGYTTAVRVQKPRDKLPVIVQRIREEAELMGDAAFYTWLVSSKNKETGQYEQKLIEGASIHLALACARNWGNIAVIQRPIEDHTTFVIFTTAVVDLETGFTYERKFRADKEIDQKGKMSDARKRDIWFQKSQSMSTRNAILNALPYVLPKTGLKAGKGSVRVWVEKEIQKAKTLKKFIGYTITWFAGLGVSEEMMIRKFGGPPENWKIDILVLIYGDYNALKENEMSVDQLYGENKPGKQEQPAADQGGNLSMDKMQMGDPGTHQGYEKPDDAAENAKTAEASAPANKPAAEEPPAEKNEQATAPKENDSGPQAEKKPDDLELNF